MIVSSGHWAINPTSSALNLRRADIQSVAADDVQQVGQDYGARWLRGHRAAAPAVCQFPTAPALLAAAPGANHSRKYRAFPSNRRYWYRLNNQGQNFWSLAYFVESGGNVPNCAVKFERIT